MWLIGIVTLAGSLGALLANIVDERDLGWEFDGISVSRGREC
jgi:hypothetical protein